VRLRRTHKPNSGDAYADVEASASKQPPRADFDEGLRGINCRPLGLTAMPGRMVPSSLVIANEYYLPALPKFKTLLCARPDQESKAALETRQQLKSLFFS